MTNSVYSSYGPSGSQGPHGYTGPTGPTGPTGSTGPTGPIMDGIGVSYADGTGETYGGYTLSIVLTDGTTFELPVGVCGPTGMTGTAHYEFIGSGYTFLSNASHGVSGSTLSFMGLTFSDDFTITQSGTDLIVSSDESGGTSSVLAGSVNELIYIKGVSDSLYSARGATGTYYDNVGNTYNSNTISLTFKNHTNVIKSVYSEDGGETFDISDANIFYINKENIKSVLNLITNMSLPEENPNPDEYSNLFSVTFVLDTSEENLETSFNVPSSFTGGWNSDTTFEKNTISIINCFSTSNGNEWYCTEPTTPYNIDYDEVSVGSCCYPVVEERVDWVKPDEIVDPSSLPFPHRSPPSSSLEPMVYYENVYYCKEYVSKPHCELLGGSFVPDVTCQSRACGGKSGGIEFSGGACCTNDTCVHVANRYDCLKYGGLFYYGYSCEDISCVPICGTLDPHGSCCTPYGSCVDMVTRDFCNAMEGIYNGDLTSCSNFDCCQVAAKGACCVSNQCYEVVANECQDIGGIFYGIGSECSSSLNDAGIRCCEDNPNTLTGACCCDTNCADFVEFEECAESGCSFYPNQVCTSIDCEDGQGLPVCLCEDTFTLDGMTFDYPEWGIVVIDGSTTDGIQLPPREPTHTNYADYIMNRNDGWLTTYYGDYPDGYTDPEDNPWLSDPLSGISGDYTIFKYAREFVSEFQRDNGITWYVPSKDEVSFLVGQRKIWNKDFSILLGYDESDIIIPTSTYWYNTSEAEGQPHYWFMQQVSGTNFGEVISLSESNYDPINPPFNNMKNLLYRRITTGLDAWKLLPIGAVATSINPFPDNEIEGTFIGTYKPNCSIGYGRNIYFPNQDGENVDGPPYYHCIGGLADRSCCVTSQICYDTDYMTCTQKIEGMVNPRTLCVNSDCTDAPDRNGTCCYNVEGVNYCEEDISCILCHLSGGDCNIFNPPCDDEPCGEVSPGLKGACCYCLEQGQPAQCQVVNEVFCNILGGHYFGDNTTCDNDPCDIFDCDPIIGPDRGSCCYNYDGTNYCLDITEESCGVLEGDWNTTTTCEELQSLNTPGCGNLTGPGSEFGACCSCINYGTDGEPNYISTCFDNIPEEICIFLNGEYQGSDTNCNDWNISCNSQYACEVPDYASCCYTIDDPTWGEYTTCIDDTSELTCSQFDNSNWSVNSCEEREDCETGFNPPYTCCIGGNCSEMDPFICQDIGGTPSQDSCADREISDPTICAGGGGFVLGSCCYDVPDTYCTPIGPYCNNNVTEDYCNSIFGVFEETLTCEDRVEDEESGCSLVGGPNYPCGACCLCLEDGDGDHVKECINVPEFVCDILDGYYYGDNKACTETQCIPETSCDPDSFVGACCTNGMCIETIENECTNGTWYGGLACNDINCEEPSINRCLYCTYDQSKTASSPSLVDADSEVDCKSNALGKGSGHYGWTYDSGGFTDQSPEYLAGCTGYCFAQIPGDHGTTTDWRPYNTLKRSGVEFINKYDFAYHTVDDSYSFDYVGIPVHGLSTLINDDAKSALGATIPANLSRTYTAGTPTKILNGEYSSRYDSDSTLPDYIFDTRPKLSDNEDCPCKSEIWRCPLGVIEWDEENDAIEVPSDEGYCNYDLFKYVNISRWGGGAYRNNFYSNCPIGESKVDCPDAGYCQSNFNSKCNSLVRKEGLGSLWICDYENIYSGVGPPDTSAVDPSCECLGLLGAVSEDVSIYTRDWDNSVKMIDCTGHTECKPRHITRGFSADLCDSCVLPNNPVLSDVNNNPSDWYIRWDGTTWGYPICDVSRMCTSSCDELGAHSCQHVCGSYPGSTGAPVVISYETYYVRDRVLLMGATSESDREAIVNINWADLIPVALEDPCENYDAGHTGCATTPQVADAIETATGLNDTKFTILYDSCCNRDPLDPNGGMSPCIDIDSNEFKVEHLIGAVIPNCEGDTTGTAWKARIMFDGCCIEISGGDDGGGIVIDGQPKFMNTNDSPNISGGTHVRQQPEKKKEPELINPDSSTERFKRRYINRGNNQ